jgi:hypothetical protein
MSNEYERRWIEVIKNHMDLVSALRASSAAANVEYFGYNVRIGTEAAPLLNGVTQEAVIAIQADADFVLSYISTGVLLPSVVGNLFANLTSSANVRFQITDTGAGETLFSQPIPAFLASGTALTGASGIPLILPIPRIIPANTNVKIEATQLGNGANNPEPVGFFVSLIGARAARF